MKISGTHAFVNQLLVGALVAIGFAGTVGLGTVWMRYQISVVADDNRALEQQYSEVQRRIADTSAMVEEAMSLDVLRAQNDRMKIGLVPMVQAQIQDVQDDPVRLFIAHANRNAAVREGARSGVTIQLNLDPAAPPATSSAAPVPRTATAPSTNPFEVHTTSTTRDTHNKLQFAFTP